MASRKLERLAFICTWLLTTIVLVTSTLKVSENLKINLCEFLELPPDLFPPDDVNFDDEAVNNHVQEVNPRPEAIILPEAPSRSDGYKKMERAKQVNKLEKEETVNKCLDDGRTSRNTGLTSHQK